MYNLLYKLYFFTLQNEQYDDLYKRIVIRLTNILLPIYFYFTGLLPSNRLKSRKLVKKNKDLYIVSLTSFPKRINNVWLTIETILRQDVKPDEIILWLYEGEFKGKETLPKKLLQQEKRGLQIKFCKENLMPHKKYYYTMLENPEAVVITIDDDIFYPSDLISKLKKFHSIYPMEIISPIVRKIKICDTIFQPYSEWSYLNLNRETFFGGLPIGAGSVLYPPKSLHKDVFDKESLFNLCLKADDLWLKIMSVRKGTKVLSIAGEYSRLYIPIIYKNNYRLMDENIIEGQNDKVFKLLMEYYKMSYLNF